MLCVCRVFKFVAIIYQVTYNASSKALATVPHLCVISNSISVLFLSSLMNFASSDIFVRFQIKETRFVWDICKQFHRILDDSRRISLIFVSNEMFDRLRWRKNWSNTQKIWLNDWIHERFIQKCKKQLMIDHRLFFKRDKRLKNISCECICVW